MNQNINDLIKKWFNDKDLKIIKEIVNIVQDIRDINLSNWAYKIKYGKLIIKNKEETHFIYGENKPKYLVNWKHYIANGKIKKLEELRDSFKLKIELIDKDIAELKSKDVK